MGEFELFYIRDKQKREVDFLMTKDHEPWMLVEAKSGERNLQARARAARVSNVEAQMANFTFQI